MKNGMVNRVSKSYFTLTATTVLVLLGSATFAAAQHAGSVPRRINEDVSGWKAKPLSPQVIATDGSWNADLAGNWSDTTKWLAGAIADGVASTGNFTFNITAGRIVTIDTTSRTLGIMNIGDSAGGSAYTIAQGGTATLTFDNGGSNAQINQTSTSGNNVISAPVVLTSSLDFNNAAATNTLTMSGVVSGAGNLNAMSGTLILTNAGNTYSGNTTISGGTLSIDSDATLGSGAGTLFLSGGTLNVSASRAVADVIANNISLTASSSITTTSSAASVVANFSGTLAGSAGTLTFNNAGADAASDVFDPRFSGGTFTMARPISMIGALGTVRLSDFNTTATTHTYDGVISGTGAFRRSATTGGTGGLTVFTAANTYTGATSIFDGILQLGNGGTTGSLSTSSAIATLNTGTFAINQSDSVVQGTDFSGAAISGAGKFLHNGSGIVTLNVANTYSGGTTVAGGALLTNDASRRNAPGGSNPELIAAANGALGTGNVSLTGSNVRLTLQGANNNLISDNATLSMVTGSTAALNQTGGSDTISGLILGGVTQTLLGTYGSTASGAQHPFDNFFLGTGTLTLIPEPSTWVMTIVGAGLLLSMQRFRRKQN